MKTLWVSTSRQIAARLLSGDPINILMQHGSHGFGLYLHPTHDRTTDTVGLEFALSDEVERAYRDIGWEAATELPYPNEDFAVSYNAADNDVVNVPAICIYNNRMVRLISIVC